MQHLRRLSLKIFFEQNIPFSRWMTFTSIALVILIHLGFQGGTRPPVLQNPQWRMTPTIHAIWIIVATMMILFSLFRGRNSEYRQTLMISLINYLRSFVALPLLYLLILPFELLGMWLFT